MKQNRFYLLTALMLLSGSVSGFGQTAPAEVSVNVDDPRSLAAAVSQLEQKLGVAINYEDIPYTESISTAVVPPTTDEQRAAHPGVHVTIPKGGTLSLPPQPFAREAVGTISQILDMLVNISNSRAPGGIYRETFIDGSFFVVPTNLQSSDRSLTSLTPVLDTPVTFPLQQRSVGDALALILHKTSLASGVEIGLGAAPFNLLIYSTATIGADRETARTVLGRLFSQTASRTLSDGSTISVAGYQLFYDPAQKNYMLNVHTLPPRTVQNPGESGDAKETFSPTILNPYVKH